MTVVDSTDAVMDAKRLSFVDAVSRLQSWTSTKNSRICASLTSQWHMSLY